MGEFVGTYAIEWYKWFQIRNSIDSDIYIKQMIGSCSQNQQEHPFRRRGTQYVTHDWITFKISHRHIQMEPKTIWILIIINMSCVIDLADPLPTRPLLLRLVQSAFRYFFFSFYRRPHHIAGGCRRYGFQYSLEF